MYYGRFMVPPVRAKLNEHGLISVSNYVDKSSCRLHNRKLNGTFSTRSQSPSNVNGANLR
ncbi:unnamed protein product [Phyllotreta striolata]|uniref:Uncharacterized protein n=1 Tax=Phyllotreta striolata TaxID=444603 RepID=A0A9N9XKL9_PHYSR|nr:unnamed protein product [Phyllotreta striolata]